jgi:parallel beta-helix repeat protein
MKKRAYAVQLLAALLALTASGSVGVAAARHRDATAPGKSALHGHAATASTTETSTSAPSTTTTKATTTTVPTTTTKPATTTLPSTTSTTMPAPTTTAPAPAPVSGVTCSRTISAPASISSAEAAAAPGEVVCLRGGVYNQVVTLADSGTSGAPITVTGYPGETAILDGTGLGLGSSSSIVNISGSYVHLSHVEIRNSTGRGITVTGSGDVVANNKVHDMQFNALVAVGSNDVIEGNEVWNTVMSNRNDAYGGGGWAEAMNTWRATNTTFRNNYIHDNWGEGIDFIASNGGVVDGNTITDNFSVLVYVDGSSNISITNNRLTTTKTTFYRGTNPPVGVLMADEGGSRGVSNIAITNNVLTHTGGISSWNVTPTNLVTSGNIIT